MRLIPGAVTLRRRAVARVNVYKVLLGVLDLVLHSLAHQRVPHQDLDVSEGPDNLNYVQFLLNSF